MPGGCLRSRVPDPSALAGLRYLQQVSYLLCTHVFICHKGCLWLRVLLEATEVWLETIIRESTIGLERTPFTERSSTVQGHRELAAVPQGKKESRETLRRGSGLHWPPGVVGFGRGLREGMPWPEVQWRASTLSFKGTVYLSQRSRLQPCMLTLGKQVRATLWKQRSVFSW